MKASDTVRVAVLLVLLPGCWLDFGGFAVCGTDGANPCSSDAATADGSLDDSGPTMLDGGRDAALGDAGFDAGTDGGSPDAGPPIIEVDDHPQGTACNLDALLSEDGTGALLARVDGPPPLDTIDGEYVTGCVRIWGDVRRVVFRSTVAACGADCTPCGGHAALVTFAGGVHRGSFLASDTWQAIETDLASPVTLCRNGAGTARHHIEVDYAGL